ncbi:AAA family ATPase [Rhizobium sp. TRM96647]|uniref:ATP-binding protein n=1 Tax=unclassified Rhizobium TaxID=2613769 RepID=UPI0021E97A17|nr:MULTISPECIES: AAA family ATPase [unclassified Rhizobium]MCV3738253.1 AAA family ATPase [Rhizobium sp. TRM96647]MCV3759998.1 AAA family ATPase [Rhizobium sp. TRM96650]
MRLNRLDLARYGKFTDRRLDFGTARAGMPDFHLVYGPNEAGKSTLFSAYLDLLFGIELHSTYNFLHPHPTMRIGADVTIGAERHEVMRLKRRQGSLVDPDDRVLPDTLFASVLGGMDRQAYQMMFSLDDESIERGGEGILKSEGELGALLFSASSGLSGIATGLEKMKAEADAFFRPQARKHELATLKSEMEALREERRTLDVAARDYAGLTRQLEASTARYDEALRARSATGAALDALERRLAAIPLLERLRGVRAQLADFDPGDAPPKEWNGLVATLMREEAELAARGERIAMEDRQRQEALDALVGDPAIRGVEADIAALAGSPLEARYRTAGMDLDGRIAERDRLEGEIAGKLARIALPAGTEAADLLLPPDRAATLAGLVAARAGLDERLLAARREEVETDGSRQAAAAALVALEDGGQEDETTGARDRLVMLARTLRSNGLANRLRDGEREVSTAQATLAASLDRLDWGDDVETVRAADIPGRDTIESLKAAVRRHAEAAEKMEAQARDLVRELAGQRAGLERLRRSETLVGDDEAGALRRARDEAWQAHRAALDAGTAERFEDLLRKGDHAADQRLAQAGQLSELRLIERALAGNEARLETLEADLERAAGDRAGLDDRIRTLSDGLGPGGRAAATGRNAGAGRARPSATGLAAVSLGAAASAPRKEALPEPDGEPAAVWLAGALAELEGIERAVEQWHDAIAAADHLAGRRATLSVTKQEAAEAAARLSSALGRAAPADVSATVLEELLLGADDRIAALGEAIAGGRNARTALAAAEIRHLEREAGRAEAEAAIAAWQAEWDAACEGTWLAATGIAADTARAGALLPVVHDIARLVDAKRELDRRIEAMRRDETDFRRIAGDLAERLGEEADDPLALLRRAGERLQRARDVDARGESLRAELERLQAERGTLEDRLSVHRRQAGDICTALGCDTLADAARVLERLREREDLRQRADEIAFDLARAMLTATADEAEAALAGCDEAELCVERERLRALHDDQDGELREAHAARIKAADALAAIGADGTVAAIEERRRTLIVDLAERARGYLATRAGIQAAEAALRLYRERHRSAMMRHASDAFRTISGGEYAGLATVVEKDQEILVAAAAAGGSKLARELSKGTRFQLYLALRVAGYHEVAANREILPFVADDIMETFDDGRAFNAFRLMAEMATVGQVVYLTHHQHLCDIARRACPGVTVHEL